MHTGTTRLRRAREIERERKRERESVRLLQRPRRILRTALSRDSDQRARNARRGQPASHSGSCNPPDDQCPRHTAHARPQPPRAVPVDRSYAASGGSLSDTGVRSEFLKLPILQFLTKKWLESAGVPTAVLPSVPLPPSRRALASDRLERGGARRRPAFCGGLRGGRAPTVETY